MTELHGIRFIGVPASEMPAAPECHACCKTGNLVAISAGENPIMMCAECSSDTVFVARILGRYGLAPASETVVSAPANVSTDVWYAIEYSRTGADDWFPASGTFDTEASARAEMVALASVEPSGHGDEYRIVRKTLTTEVIS